jgi:hypothetical protein
MTRSRKLLRLYGAPSDNIYELEDAQGGRCYLCGGPPGKKSFHIDHDHELEKMGLPSYRGLACHWCNVGIGAFHDDPTIMHRVADHLAQMQSRDRVDDDMPELIQHLQRTRTDSGDPMTRRNLATENGTKEKWEIVTEGTVSVWTYNKRDDNYARSQVGQRHSKFLYITTDDRQYNQEQIPDENVHLDPFTNGTLRLLTENVDGDLDTSNHHSSEDLLAMVSDRSGFSDAIRGIRNELLMRRLLAVTEQEGTVTQVGELRALLHERYPVGRPDKVEATA